LNYSLLDPLPSRLTPELADGQRVSLVLIGHDRAFGHDRTLAEDEVAGDRGAGADSDVVFDRCLENDAVVFRDKVVADDDRTVDDVTISDLGEVADLHTRVLEGVEGDAASDPGSTADHDWRPLVGANRRALTDGAFGAETDVAGDTDELSQDDPIADLRGDRDRIELGDGIQTDPFHPVAANLLVEGGVTLDKGDVDRLDVALEIVVGLRHFGQGIGLLLRRDANPEWGDPVRRDDDVLDRRVVNR